MHTNNLKLALKDSRILPYNHLDVLQLVRGYAENTEEKLLNISGSFTHKIKLYSWQDFMLS